MARLLRSGRFRLVAAGVVVVVAGLGVGTWFWNEQRTADVRGSADEEFVLDESPELEAQLAPEPAAAAPSETASSATEEDQREASDAPPAQSSVVDALAAAAERAVDTEAATDSAPALTWPTWGLGPARTRVVPSDVRLRPPFEQLWTLDAGSLIEFPPVVVGTRLYVGTNLERFLAVESDTGEIVWERDFGRCIAASPAVGDGLVYVALMDPSPCKRHDEQAPGFLVALDLESGDEIWRLRAGVTESSPLLVDGVIY
ncbi:MAG: PQQ-binding-like beta-propeller repeat protein, partial [Gaiellales bacterium]